MSKYSIVRYYPNGGTDVVETYDDEEEYYKHTARQKALKHLKSLRERHPEREYEIYEH